MYGIIRSFRRSNPLHCCHQSIKSTCAFLVCFLPSTVCQHQLLDWSRSHSVKSSTHELHLHSFSLSSRAASFLLLFIKLVCVAAAAWRWGCEVPGLKWVQISREMDKRVWRIKLCDVTSGTGRHPCLLIEPSEKHFTQGCELNAGLKPSQAGAQTCFFHAHPFFLRVCYCSFFSVDIQTK